jgi:hypothetical protein
VGDFTHASLWSGTAASWVDLSPPGSTDSYAYGSEDGQQVGYAFIGGINRASLWDGTAASWFDLSAFLPLGFTHSYAWDISSDATTIYISGFGFNTLTGQTEALLWTRPVPAAGTTLLLGLGCVLGRRRRV